MNGRNVSEYCKRLHTQAKTLRHEFRWLVSGRAENYKHKKVKYNRAIKQTCLSCHYQVDKESSIFLKILHRLDVIKTQTKYHINKFITLTRNTSMQHPLATISEHATIFSELHEVLV